MSDSARILFAARAMVALSRKHKDLDGVEWWTDKARSIAAALLSTHTRSI